MQKTEQKKPPETTPQHTSPVTPFNEVKNYGPLIQEYALIVRNNTLGRCSEEAQKFLVEHADFNESLQFVSILEHMRGAKLNTANAAEKMPPHKRRRKT